MTRGKALTLAAALLLILFVSSQVHSSSTGIGRTTQPALPAEGCNCHGEGGAGQPNPAVEIYWRVSPNPTIYAPGQMYNLSFGAATSDVPIDPEGNKGGFNLRVNIGALAAGPGYETYVQQLGDATEFTHTVVGDREKGRDWNLTWTAPAEATEPAVFKLWINTVDGTGMPEASDHFNMGIFVIPHAADAQVGAGAEGIDPEHIGVNWLAHWVGIVSILAVVGTLLIYYFVLKYGESIHTTDHRDRKEK